MIYGIALLAFSFLFGQWMGIMLGHWIGIDSNVGGVGFAMIILILAKEGFQRKGWYRTELDYGIDFWGKLYIPVVVAMAASLNVKVAVTSGSLAIAAGLIPVIFAFIIFRYLNKTLKIS
jgi:malonate transporter MadL subunit